MVPYSETHSLTIIHEQAKERQHLKETEKEHNRTIERIR
jgi:hypothetical protein